MSRSNFRLEQEDGLLCTENSVGHTPAKVVHNSSLWPGTKYYYLLSITAVYRFLIKGWVMLYRRRCASSADLLEKGRAEQPQT